MEAEEDECIGDEEDAVPGIEAGLLEPFWSEEMAFSCVFLHLQ